MNLLIGTFFSPNPEGTVVAIEERTMRVARYYGPAPAVYDGMGGSARSRTPSPAYLSARPQLPFSPEETKEALSKKTDAVIMMSDLDAAKKLAGVDSFQAFKDTVWKSQFVADDELAAVAQGLAQGWQAAVVANASGEKPSVNLQDVYNLALACAMFRNSSKTVQVTGPLKAAYDKLVSGTSGLKGVSQVAVQNFASAVKKMCEGKNGEKLVAALGGQANVDKLDSLMALSTSELVAANEEVRSIFISLMGAKLSMLLISLSPAMLAMLCNACMQIRSGSLALIA